MTVRPYQKADGEALKHLYENLSAFLPEDCEKERFRNDEEWNRFFFLHKTAVAEDRGEIVGFGMMEISVACSICALGRWKGIYVREDRRNRGIGSKLLAAVERLAAESAAGTATAEIPKELLPFFRSAGYTETREQIPKDCVTIRKSL